MASKKGLKALVPAAMPVDGRGLVITDGIVFGAAPGVGSAGAASDTIDFRIPGGMRVCDLAFIVGDLDTGAALLFGVGYRAVDPSSALVASSTYFAAAGQTVGQAGGRLECSFVPIKFEEDVYIQLVIGTAAAGIAGNPRVDMIAIGVAEGIK